MGTAPTSALDGEAIAQLMVGRELSSLYPTKHEADVDEEIVLSVKDLSTGFVKNASFQLKRGEALVEQGQKSDALYLLLTGRARVTAADSRGREVILATLVQGDYLGACEALLHWRFQAGRDCREPRNWGPQGCKGVWLRQQSRHKTCMALQN